MIVRVGFSAIAAAVLLATPGVASGIDPGQEPRKRLTAADNRRAKSAVVRKADLLPSYRLDSTGGALPSIPHCGGYPGNRSRITITGTARAGFTNGSSTIGSTVLYFKRQLDFEAYWRLTVQPTFATCHADLYAQARQAAGVTAETLEAGPTRIGATGANRVIAYRIATRLSKEGVQPFEWHQTFVFASWGRALALVRVASAYEPCDCYTGLTTDAVRRLRAAR